jgi:alanine dehydrogenase
VGTLADLRARIVLEHGYGDRYGASNRQLAAEVAGMPSRAKIIATSDVVLLPKPTLQDVSDLRDGQVLWGWPHAVRGLWTAGAFLAGYDIVVNCVLQDSDSPLMFVVGADVAAFRPGSLIVDVSCDAGMGFDFGRPTSFEEPMFTVGDGVAYCGVDHSPTYLWNSATWGSTEALIPYVRTVMGGPPA